MLCDRGPHLDTRLDASCLVVGVPLGSNSLAQHLDQAVDVGTRAPLGDRDQQAATILLAAGERMQVRAGVDALGGAATAHGGDVRVEAYGELAHDRL